ncbi:MAG: hypothetical protein HOW73_26115 [Polyangiaceae bacterium]|nr:hypothetical protein [Polyangiaceae bacterium]
MARRNGSDKSKKVARTGVRPKAVPEAVSRPFAAIAGARAKKAAATEQAAQPKAKPTGAAKKRASDDDIAFAMHMRDVTPLSVKSQRVPATASALDRASRERGSGSAAGALLDEVDSEAREDLAELVSSGLRFEVLDDGKLLEGRRLDVDPRELRRLRQQRYAIDGKLDLHGHDVQGAKLALERFVERRRSQGDRALLIVHGKGIHSPRQASVLRGEIGAWLSQGRAAKDVLAFASVEEDDGASGALMVLLAKR